VRRRNVFAAVEADVGVTHVVAEDDDDVGRFLALGLLLCRRNGSAQEYRNDREQE
jgi:hypothetical protein